MKKLTVLFLFISFFSGANESTVLLTGVVTSAENHLVTAPKSDRWQVQIQWMADEGSIVKEGELVTVFDSGGIEAQIEQNEERLAMEKLELKQIEMQLEQSLIEAKGRLTLADIMVEKTRIEASIPDGEISAYDKGKHSIAYEKALVERIKAKENFKLKAEEQNVGVEKQKIEIVKLEEDILYKQSQLAKLSVNAKVTGPVSHMMHPHMEQKVAIGMNVQASWKVLMIQAQSAYQVTTWIHEVDAARMQVENSAFTLELDAYPGKSYSGKVLSMSSQAEQKSEWSDSAYYRIDIAFDDVLEQQVFPGMSVKVELNPRQTQLAGGQ